MQVCGSEGSSQVSAADKLASTAKGTTQAKGKGRAVANSPFSSRHDVAEFAAPLQAKGKGKVAANSPASSSRFLEAQASLRHAYPEGSASRWSPSSSSALTLEGMHELKHCVCCWCTGQLFSLTVAPLSGNVLCL